MSWAWLTLLFACIPPEPTGAAAAPIFEIPSLNTTIDKPPHQPVDVDDLLRSHHLFHLVDGLNTGITLYWVPLDGDIGSRMTLLWGNTTAENILGERILTEVGQSVVEVFPQLCTPEGAQVLKLARDAVVTNRRIYVGELTYGDEQSAHLFDVTIHPLGDQLIAYEFETLEVADIYGIELDAHRYRTLRRESAVYLLERIQADLPESGELADLKVKVKRP